MTPENPVMYKHLLIKTAERRVNGALTKQNHTFNTLNKYSATKCINGSLNTPKKTMWTCG
jgi:hypothetical protein